ncbi:MAG: DUF1080 domain-containing protein, partial [Muribaculaceae bacterium]|nr:DUF1080 domain-containing protein [Muribaculaceae bacterium]
MKLCTTFAAIIIAALYSITNAASPAPSGLNAHEFNKYWRVESEGPYRLTFSGDTAEITAPKGLTLWRNEKMCGRTTVEYDAMIVTENPDDRLSDLNCFWMASDPKASDIWARMKQRGGTFVNCYALQLYYMGYGGNYNSTTRFRRYTGDERGITDATYRPAILKEYTDSAHLLVPGHWYHIKVTTDGLRTQYFINGERLVDYRDPQPLTEGWFGFRTTLSRARITNFSYTCEPLQPLEVPLGWIGNAPAYDTSVTLGIPFDSGKVNATTPLHITADGTTLSTDHWPLAYWPDGSIKWAAVAATIPGGASQLNVRIGSDSKKRTSPAYAPLAEWQNGQIVVSTVNSKVYISPAGSTNLIDSIVTGAIKTSGATKLTAGLQNAPGSDTTYTTHMQSRVHSAKIERNGSQRAVIKLTGSHRTANGQELLPWTVRLYFYAGTPDIKMIHTFIYDGDQHKDFINALGIQFDVPMRERHYNRHVAFAMPDGGVWSEPV